jgi:hypothetical protein
MNGNIHRRRGKEGFTLYNPPNHRTLHIEVPFEQSYKLWLHLPQKRKSRGLRRMGETRKSKPVCGICSMAICLNPKRCALWLRKLNESKKAHLLAIKRKIPNGGGQISD